MKKNFISIIIPTRRKNQILRRCLNSLSKQTYSPSCYEIILVSKRKIKINQPGIKIKIITISPKINHAEARNMAVKKARGEIIAFCDDDCILPQNWLSTASAYFTQKRVDLIGGPIIPPKERFFSCRLGAYLSGSKFAVGPSAPRWRKAYPEQKANAFNLILANTFMRKNCFMAVGGFDARQVPCEENLLYYKLQQKGYKLLYTPKITCLHPSKPIFLPYARKVFFYSTGRGILLAKEPQTSQLAFWIPSFFVIALLAIPLLSLFSKTALFILLVMLSIYSVLNFAQAFYIFWFREKDLRILLAAPIATFLLHLSYGLGVLKGFSRYKLGKRGGVLMPNIPKA